MKATKAKPEKWVRAWWFEPSSGELGYDDGRTPRKGTTHTVKGQPVLCEHGLHASLRPLDALKYAASGTLWGIAIWRTADGTLERTLTINTARGIAFSPDGAQIVSTSGHRTFRVWDARTGVPGFVLRGQGGITSVAFSPDGAQIELIKYLQCHPFQQLLLFQNYI